MRKIGYLRVSTKEQKPDRQIDGLRHFCDELHVEKRSATCKHRPVYEQVLASLRPGDMLVIWDLDRAYRSARDALNELDALRERGIEFRIANLNIDTSTASGILVYTIMSALAEFERRNLIQRTKEGIAAARRRGAILGRPRKLSDAKLRRARRCLERRSCTLVDLASEFKVAPWTLSRSLKRAAQEELERTRPSRRR